MWAKPSVVRHANVPATISRLIGAGQVQPFLQVRVGKQTICAQLIDARVDELGNERLRVRCLDRVGGTLSVQPARARLCSGDGDCSCE